MNFWNRPSALALCVLAGCQSSPRPVFREVEQDDRQRLNHGYALLHQLLTDEGDAEKIFILKEASERTRSIVRVISAVSREARERLEALAAEDPALKLGWSSLPEVEFETRKSIGNATAKKLLFGPGFEVRFVNSQAKAVQYAEHLARTLAVLDPAEKRKAWLLKLASIYERLEYKILDRLDVRK